MTNIGGVEHRLTWGVRQSEPAYPARWFWWRKAAGRGSPHSRPQYWSPSSHCWSSATRCPGTNACDWNNKYFLHIKINDMHMNYRSRGQIKSLGNLGNPSQRVHSGVQLRASSRGSSTGSSSSLLSASASSSRSSETVWMTRRTTWDWAVWALSTATASL